MESLSVVRSAMNIGVQRERICIILVKAKNSIHLTFVLWKAARRMTERGYKWLLHHGFSRPAGGIRACQLMSKELHGLSLDIHGGGPDL